MLTNLPSPLCYSSSQHAAHFLPAPTLTSKYLEDGSFLFSVSPGECCWSHEGIFLSGRTTGGPSNSGALTQSTERLLTPQTRRLYSALHSLFLSAGLLSTTRWQTVTDHSQGGCLDHLGDSLCTFKIKAFLPNLFMDNKHTLYLDNECN